MSLKRHILFICFCLLFLHSKAQTEAELKENAEQLFLKEQYVEATSLFLRLLSLQPRSFDYNYKYGTCLLYNSNKKEEAIRYLSYAIKDASVDPAAFFFIGKAYHLNYQFNDAIREYQNYQSKAGVKGKHYQEAERNMEMCRNGKKLLSTITEIIVTKKTEIKSSDFFRIYDLSNIGGSIVVAVDFQSKVDKKMNHVPIVHFPVGTDKIFYGSYGDNNQLDIYLVRRLPDGKFSLPQKVEGGVNSVFDENYPYLHPTDGYLYFSSKGHNSMGGYDVFRAKYLEESNSFGPPENIDFAISSPDDDIMYMVDKDDKNAYFASARQSQDGKLYVYEVKVDRVPIQLAIVKGKFESGINPENKKMSVEVIDKLTDKNIGKFNTTKDGTYLITFPKGGKYEYQVTVDGSNEKFTAMVEIPYLKEFKPLKQKILHEAPEGSEKIRVVNLFNEEVEDAQAIIAQVLKQRSDLNVNVNEFDLKELDNIQKTKQVLAELGLGELSLFEVGQLLEQKSNEIATSSSTEKNDHSASNAFVISTVNEISRIDKEIKELVKEADQSQSVVVQHSLLKEAQVLADERALKLKEMNDVQSLQSKIAGGGISETTKKEFATKAAAVQQFIKEGNEAEALKIIASSKETFNEVLKGKSTSITNDLLAKQKELDKQLAMLNENEAGFTKDIDAIEAEIRTLEEQKGNVKDKFKEEIQQKIEAKQSQLKEFKGQRDVIRAKQQKLSDERKLIVNELEVINSLENYAGPKVTDLQASEAKKSLNNENATTIDQYIDSQLADLVKNNPELENSTGKISESEKIIAIHNANAKKVIGNDAKEKNATQLIALNKETIDQLQERLATINNLLETDRFNEELRKEKENITNFIARLQKEITDFQNAQTLDIAQEYTTESIEKELAPNYSNEKSSVENNTKLSKEEKLAQLNSLDQNYLAQLDQELSSVQNALKQDGSNQNLIAKEKALMTSKEKISEELKERQSTLENSNDYTLESLQAEIAPNHLAQKRDIAIKITYTTEEKLELLNKEDESYIAALQQEMATVSEKLQQNQDDKIAQTKLKIIEQELNSVEQELTQRTEELAQLKKAKENSMVDEKTLISNLDSSYFEAYKNIESNKNLSTKEIILKLQKLDNKLLDNAQIMLDNLQWKILEDPSNVAAIQKMELIEKVMIERRQDIANRERELEKLKNPELDTTLKSNEDLAQIIEERIKSDVVSERKELENSTVSDIEKQKQLLAIENSYLAALEKDAKQQQKALDKDSQNENLKNEVALIESMIEQQKIKIVEISTAPKSTNNNIVAQLDPEYQKERARIEKLNVNDKYTQLLELESEHQQKLESEIAATQISEASEEQANKLNVLSSAYSESIARSNELRVKQNESAALTVETKIDKEIIISEIRQSLLKDNSNLLTKTATEIEALRLQEVQLKKYEEELASLKLSKEKENSKSENSKIQQEIAVIETEIETVQQKRREVSVSIGEIEQTSITSTNSDAKQTLETLAERDLKLAEQLSNSELSVAEKRQIVAERTEISKEKSTIENPILENETKRNDAEISKLTASSTSSETNELKQAQKEASDLVIQANKTKSETAKNYLLKEAEKKQEEALSHYTDKAIETRISEIENENSIATIESKQQLEDKQRKFSIEIGEIEQEINRATAQKEGAKSKEIAAIDAKIKTLENQKELIEEQLESTEAKLAKVQPAETIIEKSALNTTVSFEEEFEISATSNYAEYAKTANEIITLENTKQNLEVLIEQEKSTLAQLIEQEVTNLQDHSYEIQESAKKIKQFSVEIGSIETQLEEKKMLLAQQAPNNVEEVMKFKNLVLRGINPVAKVAIAAALVPLPANGIEIHKVNESTSNNTPIAIGVSAPSGLVYRVQVGAFARPIPEELFKEFTPVSGELIANTNITRYMAGYFNNSEKVVNARDEIKTLGYADAFVVAYCDGERIPFGEARELERTGKCVAKGENEMMLEVAQKTAEKLGLSDTSKYRVSNTAYNQAPGAAKATAIEEIKGLFFTVQIAVYNKPVSPAQLLNIDPLITLRLPNGQIRYSTGVFQEYPSAVVKQNEVRAKGILDAFVTAYYNGERIGLQKAMALLEQQGQGILVDSKNGVPKTENKKEDKVVQNSKQIEVFAKKEVEDVDVTKSEFGIQIVTKNSFAEYPRDVLNRYNAKGSFYYDKTDGKVKSVIYDSEYRLPRIHGFKNDVDTVYLTKEALKDLQTNILVIKLDTDELPGDLADRLLKTNHRREIKQSENGLEIRIFAITKDALEVLKADLAVFNLEMDIQQNVELEEGN